MLAVYICVDVAHSSQSLDAQLRLAIERKRLIEVRYHGSPRLAEPHDYGVQKGIERVLVYQLSGPMRSSRQSGSGWRLLDTAKIEACTVLERTFSGSRGQSYRNHYAWDVVYARVK
jgi:hypothetical protein